MNMDWQNVRFLDQRLVSTQSSIGDFFRIAGAGDLNTVYRNRPVWATCKLEELVQSAEALLMEVPAARSAVLQYIANLVHECVHNGLVERERKDGSTAGKAPVDCAQLEQAIQRLLARLDALRTRLGAASQFSAILLNWLFELFSTLCGRNFSRPFFTVNHQRPSNSLAILNGFQQIPCIASLLKLLEATFTSILDIAADKAIHAFIVAHKSYYKNFDWITIYISDSFPPDIVGQMVRTGAAEFQAFCTELAKSSPQRVAQLQDDYAAKLRLLSDIFHYMDANRKLELRLCFFSIIQQFMQSGEQLEQFVFLVKLFLFSPDLILQFTDELLELVLNPRLVDRLVQLNGTHSFKVATSYPSQVQNFVGALLERASTNGVLNFATFVCPLMHGERAEGLPLTLYYHEQI